MRASSEEKAQWRDKCRRKLAGHIMERVGIAIEPSQVRLITGRDDQYRWRVHPPVGHLFSKQLSEHDVGAFKALCQGLGKTFDAVPRNEEMSITPSIEGGPVRLSSSSAQTSLSSRIDELQELNAELASQISELQERVASAMVTKERLEGEIELVNETNRLLRQEIQKKALEIAYFRDASYRYAEGIRKMIPIIEGLKNTATFTADGCF
ncbi:uncharacterized protein B0T15DRAFT_433663 [Chaetomium strumarium]|uniref:Uncharacterized protein n=1 Tax=Chaetomium strumarium TaxID=1170767 RepID=A0AAJ0GSG0_9PEZI|nr:hypothetical protein B0T15DRAFT_433663 [Chaetomium strumarium]